jgi:hypothetical protein
MAVGVEVGISLPLLELLGEMAGREWLFFPDATTISKGEGRLLHKVIETIPAPLTTSIMPNKIVQL